MRVDVLPPGLQAALEFPLAAALLGRRARRFSLGALIPDGPLAFTSRHAPLPLTELEQIFKDPRQAHGAVARQQRVTEAS